MSPVRIPTRLLQSRDSSVGIATDYGPDDRMIGVRVPAGTVNFDTVSRQALGPTQLPIQWVRRALFLGKSGRHVKLTTHLQLLPRSKSAWSYTSTPPIHFHGVMLTFYSERLTLLPIPRATPCRLSATAYLTHLQLHRKLLDFIRVAVGSNLACGTLSWPSSAPTN
jgi:hypothetical protein